MTLASALYAGMTNDFRVKTLGLSPRNRLASPLIRADGGPVPILYPYSRHVLPVPDDFPPHAHVTGYWFLDRSDGWQPPPEIEHFLASGTPPVYVGFGSMSGNKAQQRARLVSVQRTWARRFAQKMGLPLRLRFLR
jgi:sterol 3beta-glucosyltransferase